MLYCGALPLHCTVVRWTPSTAPSYTRLKGSVVSGGRGLNWAGCQLVAFRDGVLEDLQARIRSRLEGPRLVQVDVAVCLLEVLIGVLLPGIRAELLVVSVERVGGSESPAGVDALLGKCQASVQTSIGPFVAQERGRRGRRRRRERRWHAATLETSAGPKQITTMLGHFVDVSARGCVAGDLCCLELLAVTKEVRRPACVFIAERWHWVQKLF
mmetsp:Transcript_33041/g.106868  ORF Transcript_33041/g.106868 Transcript_33041/m.106868 type:complete len:213 (+) Transcript_33041:454-1092(+)